MVPRKKTNWIIHKFKCFTEPSPNHPQNLLNHPQIIHKIASIATSHGISAPLPGSLALATAAGSGTCQAANEQAASIKHGNSKSPTNRGFSWENHPSMGKSYHLIPGLNMFPVCEWVFMGKSWRLLRIAIIVHCHLYIIAIIIIIIIYYYYILLYIINNNYY